MIGVIIGYCFVTNCIFLTLYVIWNNKDIKFNYALKMVLTILICGLGGNIIYDLFIKNEDFGLQPVFINLNANEQLCIDKLSENEIITLSEILSNRSLLLYLLKIYNLLIEKNID